METLATWPLWTSERVKLVIESKVAKWVQEKLAIMHQQIKRNLRVCCLSSNGRIFIGIAAVKLTFLVG